MTRSSTAFLQTVLVLLALGVVAFLLWEPHLEGRNAHATPFEVYFHDPFLAYVYLSSIPFFVGLYQGFRLLTHVRRDTLFSPAAVRALRIIKYCALIVIGFVAVSFLFLSVVDGDDRPQGVVMRVFVTFLAIVVASSAAMFERLLRNAVDLKSENDLTI